MGVRGFLISQCQAAATSPQACTRWAETMSEMSSNTSRCVGVGQLYASGHQAGGMVRRTCWAWRAAQTHAPTVGPRANHGAPENHRTGAALLTRTAPAPAPGPADGLRTRPGARAQDARGAGVARADQALCIEHDDACRQVVEDGLQAGARFIQRAHAVLCGFTGIGQLLGLARAKERVSPVQLILALQYGLGLSCPAPPRAHLRLAPAGAVPSVAAMCVGPFYIWARFMAWVQGFFRGGCWRSAWIG